MESLDGLCVSVALDSKLQAALVAEVPREFAEDMAELHPGEIAAIPAHTRVFDLFRMWRLDSGSYADMAGVVVAAWERRCAEAAAAGRPAPPKPGLMHSNLSSAEDILAASRCFGFAFYRPAS
jgi:hypothetical protein